MSTAIQTITSTNVGPIVQMVTNSFTSPNTRRAYGRALGDFMGWVDDTQPGGFTKATVRAYVADMVDGGVGGINQRLAAIRKLAIESADNGLIDNATAQAICRVENIRQEGSKMGNWLSKDESQSLINAPDTDTLKGKRDRAVLAVMIGCGLRRVEVTRLTVGHIQQREGRWVVVDLVGKRDKKRSVPMPSWAKSAIDNWVDASGVVDGVLFRPMRRGGHLQAGPMTSQAVWDIVILYAGQIGKSNIAPHDLRRTFAKLARKGGAELDQIQASLGHASVKTTQDYIGENQDLVSAPCDVLGLKF